MSANSGYVFSTCADIFVCLNHSRTVFHVRGLAACEEQSLILQPEEAESPDAAFFLLF